ncbi:hypothetical protein DXV76_12400 [Rhodobacteraceae bacterium CCMM004]|nr:hypothetical protein DXV76_12400 [Rhodobacteraceae bacterium CCMM004]
MTARDDIAQFLQSDDRAIAFALARLNFTIDGFAVDTAGFRKIGQMVELGTITVGTSARGHGHVTAAVYTALNRNRLTVPPGLDLTGRTARAVSDQAMVVHECTHALMDYHRFQTSAGAQEVAAYIAGALYAKARAVVMSAPGDPQTDAIFSSAHAVVANRGMVGRLNQTLAAADPDVALLAAAVAGHREYAEVADDPARMDGIGDLMDPWYPARYW